MKKQIFNITGMSRDVDPAKGSNKYAYEIRNLRLTPQEDTTLMSLVTEKGNKEFNITNALKGNIIGYCILNDYLTVFTSKELDSQAVNYTLQDHIYRITITENDILNSVELYAGNLGFTKEMILETLSIYENEYIQKVYWIDGTHQPRFINIAKTNANYSDTSFDFVPELQLQETVNIEKIDSSNGIFSPGVIQYAFTYYNKNGAESNIFYITELNYITHDDRGGSPEEFISSAFKITIDGIDNNFEYIRIYSIQRTSLDAIPQVKHVTDIKIDSIQSDETFFIDTGIYNSIIDPTLLLYIGGREILAQTMVNKDNTLFFGNIQLKDTLLPEHIKNLIIENYNVTSSLRGVRLHNLENINNYYHYENQMNYGNTSTFKSGEHYRLGVQFQYKNGNWSEPIFLEDYTIPINIRPSLMGRVLQLPQIELDFNNKDTIITALQEAGYKKIRSIAVFPTENERKVIAQGIVNPTVFNVKHRYDNAPFSQASWFFRPFWTESLDAINNNEYITEGAVIEYRHNYCLHTAASNKFRGAEIQNMYYQPSLEEVNTALASGKFDLGSSFFVDNSIITFHSPDIEFNENLNIPTEKKFRIVGIAQINSNIGDIDILTSSPTIVSTFPGFYHKDFKTTAIDRGGRQLTSGFFYIDDIVAYDKDNSSYVATSDLDNFEYPEYYGHLIFPWQKEGSLNNDITRNNQSAILQNKIISNIKFSRNTLWLSNVWTPTSEISDIKKIYDYDAPNLVKLNSNDLISQDTINYFGTVDDLLTSEINYPSLRVTAFSGNYGNTINTPDVIFTSSRCIDSNNLPDYYKDKLTEPLKHTMAPIRMRYKTMPHAVIAFNTYNNYDGIYQEILPSIEGVNAIIDTTAPFWIDDIKQSLINNKPTITDKYVRVLYIDKQIEELTEAIGEDFIIQDTLDKAYKMYHLIDDGESLKYEVYETPPNNHLYYSALKDSDTLFFEYIDNTNSLRLVPKESILVYDTTYKGIKQSQIKSEFLNSSVSFNGAGLYVCEIYKDTIVNPFGGTDTIALEKNKWLPVNTSVSLNTLTDKTLTYKYGDTWYQRYDCLKTIPYSFEDANQIVDICSFMCESRINIDGRYDKNRGLNSNFHINNTNFNLLNKVYSQTDNFFTYRYLDEDDYGLNLFSNQITWTKNKIYGSDIDDWTVINLASTLDVNGSFGQIQSLKLYNDNIICFQDTGISKIMYNERTALSTQQGMPIELIDSGKVGGNFYISNTLGCNNKQAIQVTPYGIYFIDTKSKEICKLSDTITSLSTNKGFNTYLYNKDVSETKLFYDSKLRDVYFQFKDECLVFNELLQEFTSFLDFNTDFLFSYKDNTIAIKDNKIWKQFDGEYLSFFGENKNYSVELISAENPILDKIFTTVEIRADVLKDSIQNSYSNKTIDDENILPFTKIRVWNEYQDTGEVAFTRNLNRYNTTSLIQKYRIWRSHIPRVYNKPLERIRSTWAKIKLADEGNNKKTVIHDIMVTYV